MRDPRSSRLDEPADPTQRPGGRRPVRTLIDRLPKAELHVHLRGAMPVDVFTRLLNKHVAAGILAALPEEHVAYFHRFDNIRPFLTTKQWSESDVGDLFRYRSFDQFLATWSFTRRFIRDRDDLRRLTRGVIRSLRAQNIVYAEITVAIPEYIAQGISLDEIASCLADVSGAADIRVRWIADLVRDEGPDRTSSLLRDIISLDCPDIIGITLGGSEHRFPPDLFIETYEIARGAGLHTTVHAGEAMGPKSVWDAMNLLKPERIGHGVRAVEDPSLIAHLASHRIPLEVCPTSNIRTGIYPSHEEHPIRRLLNDGVAINIASDDPTFFGATLCDEFSRLHELGLTCDQLAALMRNGFRHAFLPQHEIDAYLSDFETALGRLGGAVVD